MMTKSERKKKKRNGDTHDRKALYWNLMELNVMNLKCRKIRTRKKNKKKKKIDKF